MFLEQYPEQYEVIMKCTAEMQEALLGLGGAPIQLGTLWKGSMLKTGTYYTLIKKIKKAIDPNNIMCPGILDLPGGRL
jgi:FAD/FMN-containing dehydrogenase